jgi:demethylspheroidene O-methyltransferase
MSVIDPIRPSADTSNAPAVSWRDRWWQWRDRLLSSPRFQRWAARFPLTRPIANRRAAQLFDIAAGFVYSQTLKACLELDLFRSLDGRTASVERLCVETGLEEEPMQRLLLAAQSLGLLQQRHNGRWGLGRHGAALLGNPGIAAMVHHHSLLYADLADPVGLLRQRAGSQLSAYWGYAASDQPTRLDDAQVQDYSRLMAESQALVAGDILDSFPLRGFRRMLDVAGGEGVFAMRAAEAFPDLQIALLDLPAVARRAQQRFAQSEMERRLTAHGGSFTDLQAFRGVDLISLVRVLHDHDDREVLELLREAHRTLAPRGSLLVAEPLAGTEGAAAVGDAYFGFYLWAMGSGRARRKHELVALLRDAGFVHIREISTPRPLLVRVLVAESTEIAVV